VYLLQLQTWVLQYLLWTWYLIWFIFSFYFIASLVSWYILWFLITEIAFWMQGWMGPNYSISTACATSNFCILNAANHIRKGEAVSNIIFLWSFLELIVPTNCSCKLNIQDLMLCGGSDAPIIPIGKVHSDCYCFILTWTSSFFMHVLNSLFWLLKTVKCRIGRFCGLQSSFTEKQWSNKSFSALGCGK